MSIYIHVQFSQISPSVSPELTFCLRCLETLRNFSRPKFIDGEKKKKRQNKGKYMAKKQAYIFLLSFFCLGEICKEKKKNCTKGTVLGFS